MRIIVRQWRLNTEDVTASEVKWNCIVAGGRGDKTWDFEFTVTADTFHEAAAKAQRRMLIDTQGDCGIVSLVQEV